MTTLAKTKQSGNFFPSVFSDFFNSDRFFAPKWFEGEFEHTLPSVNIKETDKAFNIEMAAPGFTKGDFKVNVDNDVLTISAEKKDEKKTENERYTRREYAYSSFSRSFSLPKNSNGDKMEAKYSDGILKLVLPKKAEAKATAKKEIKIA